MVIGPLIFLRTVSCRIISSTSFKEALFRFWVDSADPVSARQTDRNPDSLIIVHVQKTSIGLCAPTLPNVAPFNQPIAR